MNFTVGFVLGGLLVFSALAQVLLAWSRRRGRRTLRDYTPPEPKEWP